MSHFLEVDPLVSGQELADLWVMCARLYACVMCTACLSFFLLLLIQWDEIFRFRILEPI